MSRPHADHERAKRYAVYANIVLSTKVPDDDEDLNLARAYLEPRERAALSEASQNE